nr:MAG TPA: hypothetical protein [Caudoviricetes sp.]
MINHISDIANGPQKLNFEVLDALGESGIWCFLIKIFLIRRIFSIALGALGMFPARGVHGRQPLSGASYQ